MNTILNNIKYFIIQNHCENCDRCKNYKDIHSQLYGMYRCYLNHNVFEGKYYSISSIFSDSQSNLYRINLNIINENGYILIKYKLYEKFYGTKTKCINKRKQWHRLMKKEGFIKKK